MVVAVRRTKCCWPWDDDRDFYCQGQISHQKIPRYFQFVDAYPLTASGKVQKFVLRERAIKALGLEEVARIRTA
jgi:fatty-acyl-CoA synthase